jgi:energy-coupling factor transporter ATP-binding protein EcfA2
MTKIIAFAGKKQSGKNTCANILHGLVLRQKGMIIDFNIDWRGRLYIFTTNANGEQGWGEFDISRKDEEFTQWAEYNMYPNIKLYSFADTLKSIAVKLFDIPEQCVYGTDEEKNQVQEHLLWENMPGVITKEVLEKEWGNMLCDWLPNDSEYGNEEMQKALASINLTYHAAGPMTAREFMQFFGTEIGRKMYEKIWYKNTIDRIKQEKPEIAVIADARFPDEILGLKSEDAYVTKLTRSVKTKDSHTSETSIDSIDKSVYNRIINNSKKTYTIEQLTQEVKSLYKEIILEQ